MVLNNASNVSAGKPKVGGAIFVAPLGTPVPADAISPLDEAFENIGYISEDGVTNANSPDTEAIKAWGGDIVYNALTEKADDFNFTMIEIANPVALSVAYGKENVSGDLTTGIIVRANSKEQEEKAYVIETVLRGTILKRIVIPRAQVTEVGEVTYKDDELIGYETTISAHPDEAIEYDTHREYLIAQDGATTPDILLNRSNLTVKEGATAKLTATTIPAQQEVEWETSNEATATVDNGTITGVTEGSATVTASMTVEGTTYSDTCAVTVEANE